MTIYAITGHDGYFPRFEKPLAHFLNIEDAKKELKHLKRNQRQYGWYGLTIDKIEVK